MSNLLLILLLVFFGGTVNAQTPPATEAANKGACKLAFLDAKQVGVTRVINVETGADEGTIPTDGWIAPTGGKSLRFIKMDGQTRLAVDQYVGLGRQYVLTAIDGDVVRAAWSPDGTQIAVIMKKDKHQNLYLVDVGGSKLTRLTDWDQVDDYPVWATEKNVQFLSTKESTTALYMTGADAKAQVVIDKVPSGPFVLVGNVGVILSGGADASGKTSLQLVQSGKATPVTTSDKPILEMAAAPQGTFIALSVGGELYLINQDGTGFRAIAGNPAGSQLAWLCGDIGASNPRRR